MALNLFKMRGKPLFRLMAAELPTFVHGLLGEAGMAITDMTRVVPHQASRLGLSHIARRLHIPAAKLTDIIADYGNQVAASLPTALHLTLTGGVPGDIPKRGDTLMLLGTSAGVSMGGMILRY
jgi:3-oxoacyl-[acyl-carrier-protein] synthase-3